MDKRSPRERVVDSHETIRKLRRNQQIAEYANYAFGAVFLSAAIVLFIQILILRDRTPEWMAAAGELAAAIAIARLVMSQYLWRRIERDLDRIEDRLDGLVRES